MPGPPYTVNHKVTASDLNGTWTEYGPSGTNTFTWTASSVNPAIGNGTISARWTYIHAHLVEVVVLITCGSTSTKGTGSYSFSLPVAAVAATAKGATGSFHINDSGAALRDGSVFAATTTTAQMSINAGGAPVGSTTLTGTFTTSSLQFSFRYEV